MKLILLLLIVIYLYFLFKVSNLESFYAYFSEEDILDESLQQLNKTEKKEFLKNFININKKNYNDYINYKDNLKVKYPNFGFSKLNDVNYDSLGFCPLGHYYKDTTFNDNSENLFKKCFKCFQCNKQPGYYTSGGCLGNKDSICSLNEGDTKLPMEVYKSVHSKPFYDHDIFPQHKHNLYNSLCPDISNNCSNDKLSKINHIHMNI